MIAWQNAQETPILSPAVMSIFSSLVVSLATTPITALAFTSAAVVFGSLSRGASAGERLVFNSAATAFFVASSSASTFT